MTILECLSNNATNPVSSLFIKYTRFVDAVKKCLL